MLPIENVEAMFHSREGSLICKPSVKKEGALIV